MKIRKHKKREYIYFPPDGSKLTKNSYIFKRKDKLLKFLNGDVLGNLNGIIKVCENGFGYSIELYRLNVWYNQSVYNSGHGLRIELKKDEYFRKERKHKISKESKKYFAFSERRISLMTIIGFDISEGRRPNRSHVRNLVKVFYKSGFKDFDLDSSDNKEYIENNVNKGIPFSYWSDRCGYVRMKAVIEYFKKHKLI